MPPKKRGRKPKKTKTTPVDEPKKVHKKRGRKPKGGKIIKKINEKINPDELKKPNIILQLKCSSKDLQKQDKTLLIMNNTIIFHMLLHQKPILCLVKMMKIRILKKSGKN